MSIVPGGGGFFGGGGAQKVDVPPPPPPPPTPQDPEVTAAAERLRIAELRRRGRAATILTSSEGVLGATPLSQPRAGARLFGQ